jgi:hypothetical protein
MKTLSVVLLALVLAYPTMAQQCYEVVVQPIVSMATIDSIRTIAGSKIIEMRGPAGNRFGSVSIGDAVFGRGIQFGTVVTDTVTTDSLLTLSKTVTYTDTSGTTILGRAILNFGFYAAVSYTDGDFVGMPFSIPLAQGKLLVEVNLLDSSDTADSLDIVLFNDPIYNAIPVRDTMPATFSEADFHHIVGIVKIRNLTDLGTVRFAQVQNLNLPIGVQDNLYGRIISRKAAGMLLTSTKCLLLRFKFY